MGFCVVCRLRIEKGLQQYGLFSKSALRYDLSLIGILGLYGEIHPVCKKYL